MPGPVDPRPDQFFVALKSTDNFDQPVPTMKTVILDSGEKCRHASTDLVTAILVSPNGHENRTLDFDQEDKLHLLIDELIKPM